MTILNAITIFVGLGAFATVAGFVGSARQQEKAADVLSSLPLISNDNMQFMGNISIGFPPQNLTVIFDLNSTNIILFMSKLQPSTSIIYTNKPLVGIVGLSANTSVSIAGLNITEQELVVGIGSNEDANIAGVFGLGYTAADVNGMASPLYNLINSNLLPQQLFSLQLQLVDDENLEVDGTLFLGSLNSSLQSIQPVYAENSNISDWQFEANASFINGTFLGQASIQLSATTMAIAVPDAVYANLSQFIQPIVNSSGFVSLPCDWSEPLFSFTIGNENLTLYSADFVIGGINTAPSSTCVFKVVNSGSDIWRLGTPFLTKYYTIFDVASSRIGFVESNSSTISNESTTTTKSSSTTTTSSPNSSITKGPVDILGSLEVIADDNIGNTSIITFEPANLTMIFDLR